MTLVLSLFSHCMVGTGCPAALQETDAESPSFSAISLWLSFTDGYSEKQPTNHVNLLFKKVYITMENDSLRAFSVEEDLFVSVNTNQALYLAFFLTQIHCHAGTGLCCF